MHVDGGGEVYLESGTYAMWLPHGFSHGKELYNDANVPGERSEPIPVPLLTSLTVHVLIPRLSSVSNEQLQGEGNLQTYFTFIA